MLAVLSETRRCYILILIHAVCNVALLRSMSLGVVKEDFMPIHTPNISEPGKKQLIRLGYLTGSEKRENDMYYPKPGMAISGAITYAVDEINRSPHVLPNHTLEFVIAETYGQESTSIKRTAQLINYDIWAYIGPQETCIHEGRIAAAFNKPMVSYVSRHIIPPYDTSCLPWFLLRLYMCVMLCLQFHLYPINWPVQW